MELTKPEAVSVDHANTIAPPEEPQEPTETSIQPDESEDAPAPVEDADGSPQDAAPWRTAVTDKKATRTMGDFIKQLKGERINWRGKQQQGLRNSEVKTVLEGVLLLKERFPALVARVNAFIERELADDDAEFIIKRSSGDALETPLDELVDIFKQYVFLQRVAPKGKKKT